MTDSDLPDVCPHCGERDSLRRRYTTGGGWRAEHRCSECGRAYVPE